MNYRTTEKQRNTVLKRYHEKQAFMGVYKSTSNYHKDYTKEEDALIMAENGLTILDKAEILGRSYAAISGRRQRLNSMENGEYTRTWKKTKCE